MQHDTEDTHQPSRATPALALLLGILGVLVLAIAGCGGGPTPLESPLATPTPNWLATRQAAKQLEATWLSRTSSPEKKETARAMATNDAATASFHTPQPTVFPTMAGTPAGAGTIVGGVAGPFSTISYSIQNRWYEDTEGGSVRTNVWAGAISKPEGGAGQQGLVMVDVLRMYTIGNVTRTGLVESTHYLTPCPVGSLRIVGAVGERLRLRSTSGATFYFDVPTRSYVNAPACTPTPTLTPSPTIVSPLPTPTDTPTPRTDRTFTGDATTSGLGPSNPISGATVTLYRLTLSDWQIVESVTTDANGQFALHDAGLPESSWYLILIEYPTGYTPTLAQPGPGFLAVDSQILLSLEPLAPGTYSDNHFISLWDPNATPSPSTPTPPPLPTVPWPTPTP